jgi:hypothetical protein
MDSESVTSLLLLLLFAEWWSFAGTPGQIVKRCFAGSLNAVTGELIHVENEK